MRFQHTLHARAIKAHAVASAAAVSLRFAHGSLPTFAPPLERAPRLHLAQFVRYMSTLLRPTALCSANASHSVDLKECSPSARVVTAPAASPTN